jgi:hypothetical protein
MNWGISPHPVLLPMGEGTPELSAARVQAFPLQPHLLADAATLRCKLAKASMRGEGQGEGYDRHSFRRAAASHARCKLHTLNRHLNLHRNRSLPR